MTMAEPILDGHMPDHVHNQHKNKFHYDMEINITNAGLIGFSIVAFASYITSYILSKVL